MPEDSRWRRECALGGNPSYEQWETWTYQSPGGGSTRSFDVRVTVGKTLDILGLKGTDLSEIRNYSSFLSRTARQLYDDEGGCIQINHCPCCHSPTANETRQAYTFLGVPLHRCGTCGHGFVLNQATPEVMNAIFADSEAHSTVYVDRESLEQRLEEIIAPKLKWTMQVYKARYQRSPATAVDVGAGGGHFVEALRRTGIDADGYELSKSSRQFAAEAFNLDLKNVDFLTDRESTVDLITFWGLLEYTSQPRRFLEAARHRLDPESGLLIVEVPRLNCLGTEVQATAKAKIARHMDPTSHVNTFTDESLMTALVESGFSPLAVWYFGMDAYELLIQIAIRRDDSQLLEAVADLMPAIQYSLDHGRQSDDIVVAAVPSSR